MTRAGSTPGSGSSSPSSSPCETRGTATQSASTHSAAARDTEHGALREPHGHTVPPRQRANRLKQHAQTRGEPRRTYIPGAAIAARAAASRAHACRGPDRSTIGRKGGYDHAARAARLSTCVALTPAPPEQRARRRFPAASSATAALRVRAAVQDAFAISARARRRSRRDRARPASVQCTPERASATSLCVPRPVQGEAAQRRRTTGAAHM